jgi:L-arabinonolactonase
VVPVECVVDSRDKLGEGCRWDPVERELWWVDVPMPSRIHRFRPATGRHDTWPMPEMVTSMARRRDGTFIVASHYGLNVFDPGTGELRRIAEPERHEPRNRANDGAADLRGRFWFGTMRNNIAPDGADIPITEWKGTLYRVDPDLTVTAMDAGFGVSNSPAWSPDGRTMYFVDSLAKTIYAYDFDPERGTIANRRVFANPEGYGYPDGSAVDAEGFVWNARWEGSAVIRFAPDGSIDRVVPMPAERCTCCAFGGDDLGTLYVTTSRLHVSEASLGRHPHQGGVFALRPGVRGLPTHEFAG